MNEIAPKSLANHSQNIDSGRSSGAESSGDFDRSPVSCVASAGSPEFFGRTEVTK